MTADEHRAAGTVPQPSRVMLLAAFAAIYIIWGSTYLAIKYAVETVPPFLMTGARFLLAGAGLYAWSALRGGASARVPKSASDPDGLTAPSGTGRAWRDAFIVGVLLIVGGTSLVGWAEQGVPSGMTSLVLATTPLWMVLLESTGARAWPAPRVIAGVVVGLVGLGVLVAPSLSAPAGDVDLLGVGALALSSLSWSAGALYSRRAALPASPTRATGMQMMAGALLSLVLGVAFGEHRGFSFADVTLVSGLAVAYLLVAGALIGFSAYLWLMRVSTPSRVATHAYVNPVVAVLLGWAVAGERVTGTTLVAMVVIVAAVVLIVSAPRRGEGAASAMDDAAQPRDASQSAESPDASIALSAPGRVRAIIPQWRARPTKKARPTHSRST